jgi:leucyl aminopeptidase
VTSPQDHQPQPPVVTCSSTGLVDSGAKVQAIGFSRAGDELTVGVGAETAVSSLGLDVFALLDRAHASGKAGEVVTHELFDREDGPETVVLVGLGEQRSQDFRRAGAALTRAASGRGTAATTLGSLADDEQLTALVEGVVLGGFGFHRKSGGEDGRGSKDAKVGGDALSVMLTDMLGHSRQPLVDAAAVRARAAWRARAYALTPSNEKGPQRLEQWAKEAARAGGLELHVWDERRLQAEGFDGILAVGRGSAYPSRFLRLDYAPKKATRRTPHLVIAGKGITFDSGGLSIKPREAMMSMKRDMTGAGVVIAVMGALRDLDVPVRVTGLVASAENAVGAASMRPGDVIRHYGGRTTEVGNTDAEGRLVLADALAYADANLDADAVVDVATLTGAGKVALGTSLGALFSTDDALAEALDEAGRRAGEPLWRLPLHDDYEESLENPVADATNAPGGPGAITAALFLRHFTGTTPWAHLDIASVGDSPNDAFEYTKGATGFGARLLLSWIQSYAR